MKTLIIDTNEIWKDVAGYEGYYQVSNLGRVKSLFRMVEVNKGVFKLVPEKIIATHLDQYLTVCLMKRGDKKTHKVHKLVAIAFLDHIPNGREYVINHKDFNKQNNCLSNLEIITHRANSNRKHFKHSSIYTGVHFEKDSQRWKAAISINGKQKRLGRFHNEIDAHYAYENALKSLNNYESTS